MTAAIYLHPRSVEVYGTYGMASELKTRGFDIPIQPGARFIRAVPDAPPPWRPAPTPPARRSSLAFWRPRT